ncbi:MAG: hypothetical protein WC470_02645 [Candidatus Paceibacterota bacterium]
MRKIKRKLKTSKRKRKKANFLSRFYFSLIGAFLFLGIFAFGIIYSSQFTIKDIKAGGLSAVSNEQLTQAIKDKLTLSYNLFGKQITMENFLVPQSKKMNSVLMEFPEIESVDIKKDYINKSITFEVKKKQPVAAWKEIFTGSCYLVDKNGGFIKSCANDLPSGLFVVQEEKDICKNDAEFKKNAVVAGAAILKQTAKYNIPANVFSLLSKDKLSLNLGNGCQIYFNILDDLDWQLEKMAIVLKQSRYYSNLNTLQYIDLRFGNQAIIK